MFVLDRAGKLLNTTPGMGLGLHQRGLGWFLLLTKVMGLFTIKQRMMPALRGDYKGPGQYGSFPTDTKKNLHNMFLSEKGKV